MSIKAICPSCWKAGQVPEEAIGRTAVCPNCRTKFTVQKPEVKPEQSPPDQSKISKSTADLLFSSLVTALIIVVFSLLLLAIVFFEPTGWGWLWVCSGGVIGAVIFGMKNKGAGLGFLYGGFLGPIFIWLSLLDTPAGTRKCPFCAERVKKQAKVCKHCGRDLPSEEAKPKVKRSWITGRRLA